MAADSCIIGTFSSYGMFVGCDKVSGHAEV